jgi:hypothetical protein
MYPLMPALHAWVMQDQSRRWMRLTEDEYEVCFDYGQMGDNDTWPEFMDMQG